MTTKTRPERPLLPMLGIVLAAALAAEPGFTADPSDAGTITTIYRLDSYTAKPGKLDELHEWFAAHIDDVFGRHGAEALACLVPADARPDDENRFVFLARYPSQQALVEFSQEVSADPLWKPLDTSTDTPERLVETVDTRLFTPTDYSPAFEPSRHDEPRIFELRTYTCPGPEKMQELHERFRRHTMKLFAKHGMENLVYWHPLVWGPRPSDTKTRRLAYLLGHKSREAAQASFAAFRSDPEWLHAKQASEDRAGGSLTSAEGGVVSEFFIPTKYSPLR